MYSQWILTAFYNQVTETQWTQNIAECWVCTETQDLENIIFIQPHLSGSHAPQQISIVMGRSLCTWLRDSFALSYSTTAPCFTTIWRKPLGIMILPKLFFLTFSQYWIISLNLLWTKGVLKMGINAALRFDDHLK